MFPGDGDAEYFVAAGWRDDFNETVRFAVGDSAIEIVDAVGVNLVRNAFFLRFCLVNADASHFGVGKRTPRHHRIINLEFLQIAKQRIHRAIPRHVRSRMRELIGASHVAAGENIRINGFEVFVHFNHALRGDAERFKAETREIGDAADSAQNFIEGDAFIRAVVLDDEEFFAVLNHHLLGLVIDQHVDALSLKTFCHQIGDFRVFAYEYARCHFHLRYFRAKAREALREFAADGAAAEHDQALG